MKTKIIYSFFAVLVFIASCRKEDNPLLPDDLQKAAIPQLSKDPSGDQSISSQDIDGFVGKVVIDQYFKNDHSFKSFEAVVIKNGVNSTAQVLQSDITSLPATVTFTSAQLTSLFGAPPAPGDNYIIGANVILQSGQKIEAFPADGLPNYDPNIFAMPGLGPLTVSYAVFCPFDASQYDGDFVVVQDDWQDYFPGDVIQVTMIDATHVSFMYNAFDAQPIIVEIDPATNTTSVSKQYFGNYGPDFGGFFAESIAGNPNNYVIPCNGTLSLVLDISSDVLGDFGGFRIVLQKQ